MDVSKLTLRQKIKIIKHQVKTIKRDPNTSKSQKTLLIILSVFVAVFLLLILAAGSCSISCSGSEGIATIVFLGGTFLLVFLLVHIIKRINHPKAARKKEDRDTQKQT